MSSFFISPSCTSPAWWHASTLAVGTRLHLCAFHSMCLRRNHASEQHHDRISSIFELTWASRLAFLHIMFDASPQVFPKAPWTHCMDLACLQSLQRHLICVFFLAFGIISTSIESTSALPNASRGTPSLYQVFIPNRRCWNASRFGIP